MHVDVVVITPPKEATVRQMISRSYPGYGGVDSAPLRAAHAIEKGGFKVGFLPLFNLFYNFSVNQDTDELVEFIKEFDADIFLHINDYYIFSRSTPCYRASLHVAHLIREQNPNACNILAGNHVSVLPQDAFLDSKDVDIVVKMEGEPIFCDLIGRIQQGLPLDEVKGIVYRENGRIKETDGFGMVNSMDSLPVPAYHLLRQWIEDIPRRMGRISGLVDLTLRTSYGCPNRCAFCAVTPNWNHCRFRSADKVQEDFNYGREALKGKKVSFSYFDDENFTSNATHVAAVSDMMQREDMHIDGVLAGVCQLTKDMAETLSKFTGSALVGGENAVDSILARVNKRQTFQQILTACENAAKSGVAVDLQWLIGLPGEDGQTMAINLHTILNLIMKGNVRSVTPNVLGPQPGSDIGNNPEKYGITVHHKEWPQYYANGAYPSFHTETLNSDQIYVYYLMAKMIASEASQMRPVYESHNIEPVLWGPEVNLFREFIEQVGSS